MKRTETGWAIHGEYGLYVGWYSTRHQMIARHVYDMRRLDDPEVSQFSLSGKLSADQSRLWERMKKRGDRAVKVKITYEA